MAYEVIKGDIQLGEWVLNKDELIHYKSLFKKLKLNLSHIKSIEVDEDLGNVVYCDVESYQGKYFLLRMSKKDHIKLIDRHKRQETPKEVPSTPLVVGEKDFKDVTTGWADFDKTLKAYVKKGSGLKPFISKLTESKKEVLNWSLVAVLLLFVYIFGETGQSKGSLESTQFTVAQVCKGAIAGMFNKFPSQLNSTRSSADTTLVSYYYSGENIEYKCKASGGTINWGVKNGRWRTGAYDSSLSYFVKGDTLYIYEEYTDGSSRKYSYRTNDF